MDILAIGELNPDLILSGIDAPEPVLGTEQTFDTQTRTLGGSTAISCVLMQRLGLRCAMASLLGDDDDGRFCLAAMQAEGVDTARVRVDDRARTGVTISATYAADRLLLTRLGTMAALDRRLVEGVGFSGFHHVHSGSVFLLDALRADLPAILQSARAAGCTVSLDPGWDPSGRWDRRALDRLMPLCDLFLPNRDEALAMTGAETPRAAMAILRDKGAARVAMKAGRDGGYCAGADGLLHHPGFAAQVIDTTGAGDAFNAGFIFGMRVGWADADCLRLANACGAVAVAATGGTGGLHRLDDARAVLSRSGETLPDV